MAQDYKASGLVVGMLMVYGSTGRLQWEMVLGLTDGQSLTAFIADPMICSHVIRQRQQPPRPEEDHLTSLAASVARQRNDENFLLRLVLLCTSVA